MPGVGFLDGIVAKSSTSTSTASASALTGSRAARQDPPPRALLLLCDGMLPGLIAEVLSREGGAGGDPGSGEGSSPTSSSSSSGGSPLLRHVDAVARGGAVGTLALRRAAEADDPRLRRHAALFQLLGAHLVSFFFNRRGEVKKSGHRGRERERERVFGPFSHLFSLSAPHASPNV